MIELIIFDLDGTLVDSIQDITDSLNKTLITYNIPTYTPDETKSLVGSGAKMLIYRALPEHMRDKVDVVLKDFIENYKKNLFKKTRLFNGVYETLRALDEKGYKKAIISNKREELTKKTLEVMGIDRFFEIVMGEDTLPYKKPSPEPIYEVLRRLSVDKKHAVIVGDGIQDIEAGKAAGIKTIAVAYGYTDREKLSGADYMIDDIRELITLLEHIK